MHGQDGIPVGTGWKNYVKRLKDIVFENATDCALKALLFYQMLSSWKLSKIEEKNVNAKVDKVEARSRTGEVFTYTVPCKCKLTVPRSSNFETRSSIIDPRSFRVSRFESSASSIESSA